MLDQPQIIKTEKQRTAIIRIKVPRNEIQNVMGPGMAELMSVLAAQDIAPIGPMFSHHFTMQPDFFDFEVGVPVAVDVSPSGRVLAGELPAVTVARTNYRGSYEELGPAWGEFIEWIKAEGHKPAEDLWEFYVSGPESNPDPSTWCIELNKPLL